MHFTEQEIVEFKSESLEFLELAERSLLAIDAGEDFQSHYNVIFRTFHNLKGSSGIIGIATLEKCMHELENHLVSFKTAKSISKHDVEYFLNGVDKAKDLVSAIGLETVNSHMAAHAPVEKIAQEVIPDATLAEFTGECTEILFRLIQSMQEIEQGHASSELFEAVYRDLHTLKGSSYLFSYKELGDLTHLLETAFDHLKTNPKTVAVDLVEAFFAYIDLTEKVVTAISKKKYADYTDSLKKMSVHVNNLNYKHFINPQEGQTTATAAASVSSPAEQAAAPEFTSTPAASSGSSSGSGSSSDSDKEANTTIRVPVYLLDKLMTLMGEMVQVRNQVVQYSNQSDNLEFVNMTQRLNVVTGEMQGELMKTRMQPIGNILTKFTRVVRDLSRDLNKKIDISLSGSETELDKTLLEAIKDPLTHIIRNACDHGIETPESRRASGKSDIGHIYVKSYHEGGQVVVEVSDDGQGLNPEKLINKALEKGLINNEAARTMSERDAFNLIFAPGFSTAQKVTNVSGRGVGMDVVKSNIEKIGGSVELNSVTGSGTSIKLRIPLTLAIVPAMIVRSHNECYAIPQLKLEELILVENSETDRIEILNGSPVYRLRGKILPLIDLNNTFGLSENIDLSKQTNVVVLKSDEYTFGLIVDEILDTADIVVKPLSRFMKSLQMYSGATVLGDGSVALILDVSGIAKSQVATISAAKQDATAATAATQALEYQDFLLFKLNSPTKHALLLGYVHRLEEFKRSDIETSGQQKLVRYRNSILPLLSLNESMNYTAGSASFAPTDPFPVVVIEKNGLLFGLEVNEILDVFKTEKDLDTTLIDDFGIVGNLVSEEEVISVIDPFKVIDRAQIVKSNKTAVLNHLQRPVTSETLLKTAELSSPARVVTGKGLNILYVEDTAFFRKAVTKALELAGHSVTTAKDGREGVEKLESSQPGKFDLVISDIEMPLLNGFGFAEQMRKLSAHKHLPLVALSTKADEAHIKKALSSGFDVYMEKLDVQKLLNQIDGLMNRGAA